MPAASALGQPANPSRKQVAERLLERQKARYGQRDLATASARGLLAVGLARAGREADAMREFKLAVPILAAASLETDLDKTSIGAARGQRYTFVIEAYMALLAHAGTPEAASESFGLSDIIRGHSVQNALAASSARSVAANPILAELARKAQDLDKQIAALPGTLNHALALPSDQRDVAALKALQSDIDKLRAQRRETRPS